MFDVRESCNKLKTNTYECAVFLLEKGVRFFNLMVFGKEIVDYTGFGMICLMYFSFAINIVKEYYAFFYTRYSFFKFAADCTTYGSKYIMANLINQKIEPYNSNWISTAVLSERNASRFFGERYKLLEIYEFMNNVTNELIVENFSNFSESAITLMQSNGEYIETMITMKLNDCYIQRVISEKSTNYNPVVYPVTASNVKFLTVEYTHPIMQNSIFIELDRKYFYEKNDILSPLFVKRYLDYQAYIYYFDMDYKINILDSNITMLSLFSNQYVTLGVDDYEIRKL